MVRIGVIGVGFGAKVQVPAFQSEGFEVAAVCSRREDRAKEAAASLGIPHAYTDYRRMLEQPDLDAVSVVTPPHLHHDMAVAALDAGKHVLCEKPFAMDRTQAGSMRDKARSTGLTAMVAHEFRFAPARAHVKELLEQGYVGRFRTASVTLFMRGGPPGGRPGFDWRRQYSYGGGQLGGLGSHYIDCLRDWFGEVRSVSGRVFTPEEAAHGADTSDDAFGLLATFARGGWASLAADFAAPLGSKVRMEVHGDEGSLSLSHAGVNPPPDGTVFGARHAEDGEMKELPAPERFRVAPDERDARLGAFRVLAQRFRQGIEEGTSPAPNFEDGYRCQQVMDAVRFDGAGGWVEIEG